MKKVALIIFAVLAVNVSYAQEKKNIVKINIVGAFGGQYQLAYERVLNNMISLQLSAGYITRKGSQSWSSNSYESTTSGFIIIPEFRYYPLNNNIDIPKGLYIAPFGRFRLVTQDINDTSIPIGTDVSRKDKISVMGGGLVAGYQFLIANQISFDIFLGPQYKSRTTTSTYDQPGVTDSDFNSKFLSFKIVDKGGAGIRFGFNLGIAF